MQDAKKGPQPLSAYEHALLEFRNARLERAMAMGGAEGVDEDDDGVEDSSMVEVVTEKRWSEMLRVVEIFNGHEHVKHVRMCVRPTRTCAVLFSPEGNGEGGGGGGWRCATPGRAAVVWCFCGCCCCCRATLAAAALPLLAAHGGGLDRSHGRGLDCTPRRATQRHA